MLAASAPVLVLNAGSSSLKFGFYAEREGREQALVSGVADRIAQPQSGALTLVGADGHPLLQQAAHYAAPADAFAHAAQALANLGAPLPAAIGHRIVHGGPHLRAHTRITPEVLRGLEAAVHFAPLHIPAALALVRAAERQYPGIPQFACFDTAFHAAMPAVARTYPLPARYRELGVERFGFHGLSYESIVCALGTDLPPRVVAAHLGNGASLCALLEGKSVDTTMGLTPTGGIPMGTRSGDLDPGVVLFLARNASLSTDQLEALLNHQSGLAGLAGMSDMRALSDAAGKGDADAQLAIAIFARSIAKSIAAYAAVLAGLDLVVFAGGIGEHSAEVRARACAPLAFLGVELDPEANLRSGAGDGGVLSTPASRVRVQIVPADEDRQIARHVRALA